MKHLKFFFIFAVLLTIGTTAYGQDVTIRANNGACVAAVKNGGVTDTFFNLGGFATWQHEQLNMVLTVSDGTALTPIGQLDNPANNLFKSSDGVHMQIAHGAANNANVCYATVSLPSGYRFTEYLIEFTKPSGVGNNFNGSGQSSTFGETNSTFATYATQATISTGGAMQTIHRAESDANPMGNVLYFKLQNPTNSRALIELVTAKFYFTAEENFSPVTPASEITTPVSATLIPYPTSKVDFGTIQNRNYNGAWRISYESANVTDINANFLLYEAESTKTGADIDNISGRVVDFKEGSQYTITSEGGYFKLGKGADATEEQVYYIETPTTVEISDGHQVPIGYRIVGAEFDYTNGAQNATFYITRTGRTKYYLNTEGRFTTTPVVWEIDSEGYISSNGNYLYFNNGYAATQRQKPSESERFAVDGNNNIYQIMYPTYFITYLNQNNVRYGMISNTTGEKATYEQISAATTGSGSYTLKIYDKEGNNPTSINVTGTGKTSLSGLNNDAVKFGVIGQGFVRATLTIQALDPYLDQMTVWCNDEDEPEIKMFREFNASDFSVNGGEFDFYLPDDCIDDKVAITFEDLQSKYFDETYPTYNAATAPHYSRLNFVNSAHYNAFGTTTNVIYSNPSEAANAQLERLKVGIVGSAPFKFNNADQVGTSGGTITEYAFSLANYAAAPNNGSFGPMEFTVSSTTQTQTRYVFTTDETRYNIAPTTATQHRAYAFYQMKVNIHSNVYEPRVKFEKIYNETLYGTGQKDAFYSAVISTNDPAGAGFASIDEAFDRIAARVTAGTDDVNNAAPASAKQILYVDFSDLEGIYQRAAAEGQTQKTLADYMGTCAANCLVFVPEGAGATTNNVAEKIGTNTYRATQNVVLTDKQPFYTPFNIQVPSANTMTYKRQITLDKYGKVNNATIILPFAIQVQNGVHTNPDGTSFSLHTLQAQDALKNIDGLTYAYMPNLGSAVSATTANMPYVVHLDENSTEDNISFVVVQPGAPIAATTSMASDYTFTGGTGVGVGFAEGDVAGKKYTLTSKGTYAGKEIAKNPPIFYFANNHFVCSSSLDDNHNTVKVAPFRAYYAAQVSNGGSNISSMEIIFGEGIGDTPTGINDVTSRIDTGIKGGKGTITIMSAIDNNVKIYNTSGMNFMNVDMQAGETKTVNVPAGVYVVNGVKIIVK